MGKVGVLASGSGTNFQNLVESLKGTSHSVVVLLSDKKESVALQRAQNLGVPGFFVSYGSLGKEVAETEITRLLEAHDVDLVALAGFMRILSPDFVRNWRGRLINIHPSLLPRHPGAHGIRDSFLSGDPELGVTVHWVDEGVDTGPILGQRSFRRTSEQSLEEVEKQIHELEYQLYPAVVRQVLDDARTGTQT